MTATNHAVMGAIVVAAVGNPVLGLPLALASHFVLDSLPHFGAETVSKPGTREYAAIIRFDTLLTTAFILIVSFAGFRAGFAWWLLPLGAFIGWAPDIMWYKHYQSDLRGEERQWDPVRRMHKKIQRYEVSWGWIVESVWFVVTVALLSWLIFR